MLAENTYGDSAAARILVERLNRLDNPCIKRRVGRRITSTSTAVNDLVNAFSVCSLTPTTLASVLKEMRLAICRDKIEDDPLIDSYVRNVRIAHVKRGMRTAELANIAKHVMENPVQRGTTRGPYRMLGADRTDYYFTDHVSGRKYLAGAYVDCVINGHLSRDVSVNRDFE